MIMVGGSAFVSGVIQTYISEQIDALHNTLEAKGNNSRRVKGLLDGRVFSVPVDAEHKATRLPILNCANPHMRAFHASWFGFFSTFFSVPTRSLLAMLIH